MSWDRRPTAARCARAGRGCESRGATAEIAAAPKTTPAPADRRSGAPTHVARPPFGAASLPGTVLQRARGLGWFVRRATHVGWLERPLPAGREDAPACASRRNRTDYAP